MKTLSLLSLLPAALAHYNLPAMLTSTGAATTDWQYVRQWTDYYAYTPVQDVTSLDIRCNVAGTTNFAAGILDIPAGSTTGMTVAPDIYHPGPVLVYMAKVPAGKTAANWDGSGAVWFKVFQQGPIFGGQALTWPSNGATKVNFTIPKTTPSGNYLVRVEQIALHVAQSEGAAQFYLSCGQINVTGGGSGAPGPLVAFPGAYKATDPGILININYPVPTSYTFPGPAVWTG
ncbi:MAG: hypothetical protein MMC23_003374 [Stictis urceolatum]|nr:hypothetical protein [Stictis urceolata]